MGASYTPLIDTGLILNLIPSDYKLWLSIFFLHLCHQKMHINYNPTILLNLVLNTEISNADWAVMILIFFCGQRVHSTILRANFSKLLLGFPVPYLDLSRGIAVFQQCIHLLYLLFCVKGECNVFTFCIFSFGLISKDNCLEPANLQSDPASLLSHHSSCGSASPPTPSPEADFAAHSCACKFMICMVLPRHRRS